MDEFAGIDKALDEALVNLGAMVLQLAEPAVTRTAQERRALARSGRSALFIPVIIIALFSTNSNEASARCNRGGSTCREPPIAQGESIDARQGGHRSIARISPASTGCYGFDHGPVYSPRPCNFPYNCEMFDGACGDSRAWAHTIGR